MKIKGFIHTNVTTIVNWNGLKSNFKFHVSLLLLLSDRVSLCHPCWSTVASSQLTVTSSSWAQAIPPPQPPGFLKLQVCATTPG